MPVDKGCFYCKNKDTITYCKFCKKDVCIKHTLPENHKCKKLLEFRKHKLPKVEKLEDNPLYMEDYAELSKLSKLSDRHRFGGIINEEEIRKLTKSYRKDIRIKHDSRQYKNEPIVNSVENKNPDYYSINKKQAWLISFFILVIVLVIGVRVFNNFDESITGLAVSEQVNNPTTISNREESYTTSIQDSWPVTIQPSFIVVPEATTTTYKPIVLLKGEKLLPGVTIEYSGDTAILKGSFTLKNSVTSLDISNIFPSNQEISYSIKSEAGINVFFTPNNAAYYELAHRYGGKNFDYYENCSPDFRRSLEGICYTTNQVFLIVESTSRRENNVNYTLTIRQTSHDASKVVSY